MTDRPPRFELLGPLRAWHGSTELDLGPGKQRAVLAMLVLHANRPVAPAAIIDAVWQDDPPENGPNVVQKYVAGLRRALDPAHSPRNPGGLITLTPAGYLLTIPAGSLDTDVFARQVSRAQALRGERRLLEAVAVLREATSLWRAEPLGGLPGPAFDAARERLLESRAAALETMVELELELGRHVDAATRLVGLVAEFPLREGLRHLLILALYRCGRQAEALAAYRDARALLADEFGVEPGERLQQLHRAILQGDPALLRPAAFAHAGAPAPAIHAGPPGGFAPPPYPLPLPPTGHPGAVYAPPGAWTPYSMPVWAPYPQPPARPVDTAGTLRIVLAAIGGAVPLLSCGFASFAVMGFFAAYRRSWRIGLCAAVYLALAVVAWTTVDTDSEQVTASDDISMLAVLVMWVGGIAQGVFLGLDKPRHRPSPTAVQAIELRVRREQARRLMTQHPDIARRLHIGRPDLAPAYDDGGLVDVNGVPAEVLARVPGISPEQARRIVEHRTAAGPLLTVDQLVDHQLLPRQLVDEQRDVLVALV
ncbi:BTAD domain-containing putative transcriptional regulator [Catellatospora sichuanensis]|uniref:BTAD domain-containing putative transcriptional regulator n=1 Tax=Catellatospora sichuanensis TaxID=1969805 RepID=UPI0011845EFC|nr:BTAD domain-containing putative transcriptional regulator [Catellatospora sichuanensis]